MLGGALLVAGQRQRRICRRATSVPYDYYGLLGLERYTKDKKAIKAAFRRVVKLVHPDILGNQSMELQRLVGEAYNTLSDDSLRQEYDGVLALAGDNHGSLGRSVWPDDAPAGVKAIFVDQTVCHGCFKCVDMAGSTFIEDPGQGSARVETQWGDSQETLEIAFKSCPSKALRLVDRKDLAFLEKAMGDWLEKRSTCDIKGAELAGPFEAYQAFQFSRIEAMDFNDPDGARKVAEKIDSIAVEAQQVSGQANDISEAAAAIPEDVRQQVWGDGSVANGSGSGPQGGKALEAAENRNRLIRQVFMALDTDEDGWLREDDMRRFANCLGFEGSAADWREEYRLLCMQNCAHPLEGVGEILLLKLMADEEDSYYCTDEELEDVLNQLVQQNPVKIIDPSGEARSADWQTAWENYEAI